MQLSRNEIVEIKYHEHVKLRRRKLSSVTRCHFTNESRFLLWIFTTTPAWPTVTIFLHFNVCFGLWFIIATICWGRKCFCLAPFKLSKPIVINCVLKQRDREEVLWNVSQSLKIRAEGLEKINVRDAIKNQNTKLTFVHFLATVKQMFRHPHSSSSERRSNACSFCFWVLETVSTIVWDLISFWMEIYGATKEFRFEESLSTFD